MAAAEAEQAGVEIMDLVRRFCGGRSRFALLDREHPWVSLEP